MKRALSLLVATWLLAPAANAVSVALVADQTSYLPGDTVTISVVVDAVGANDTDVFGTLVYDPTILLGGSVSQAPLTSFGGTFVWQTFSDCPESPGECTAFLQQSGAEFPISVDQPAGFVISTLTFTAGAPGSTDLDWKPPGQFGTVGLDFFGLGASGAPGITVTVVPEPATAALCAFGLVALAASRRARR